MAKVVIGTSPATGEVLVRDTETGELSWRPGTPEQIARVTAAIEAAPEFAPIEYEPYEEPPDLPPPPPGTVFDSIISWIQNAIDTIPRTITDWIASSVLPRLETLSTWVVGLWDKLTTWFTDTWNLVSEWVTWLRDQVAGWFDRTWSTVSQWAKWLGDTVADWFNRTWSATAEWTRWLHGEISSWFTTMAATISQWVTWAVDSLNTSLAQVITSVSSQLESVLDQFKAAIPEWLLEPGKWVQELLDGIADWLMEDIPGHSPRWTAIFEQMFGWLRTWFFEFPKWLFEQPAERVAYGLSQSFEWIGDTLAEIFDRFNSNVIAFAKQVGPMSPTQAVDSWSSIAKVGFAALAGLTGMTVAGELLHPLKRIGLGNLAAMVYDMTNYKLITGAFIGAMATTMLKTPLTYYFNDLFRPWILRPADFMELMSREAFTDPDKLRVPELSEAMRRLAPQGGEAFERAIIGFYGYPPEYHGLFKELANTRLGYFALAGIARSGFFDREWFIEALSRTGYSRTAREALLKMYEEQVKQARQQLVMGIVRRHAREGFADTAQVKQWLDRAAKMESMDEIRLFAMELEQEYEAKSMALDINLRAFSRGVIPESEVRRNLARIIKVPRMIDTHLLREKLGLIRRITIPTEELPAPFQIVEE